MGQLDNQIGYAPEVTYGTRVAPTRFLEFNTESIERNQVNRASAGLRKGQQVARSDRQSQSMKGAGGSVSHDLAFTGFGLLLKQLFGKAPAITQPDAVSSPTVYEHVYTLGDGAGMSLTAQVGRPGTAGTVHPFDYLGLKVTQGTLGQELDAYAKLDLTVDAQDEKDDQTLATPSYAAAQNLLHDGMLSVTVDGTEFDPKSSSMSIDRALSLDRYFQRASTLKKEPIASGLKAVTGNLEGEFEDLTTFNKFKAGDIVPVVFSWVGDVIEDALRLELTITFAACRLEGPKPVTSGPGILAAPTPFTVLYNGTDEPVSALLRTTDSAV